MLEPTLALSDEVGYSALDPRLSLVPTSLKNHFIMESLVPPKWKYQFNPDEQYFAVTGIYLSDWTVSANDKPIMARQLSTCSIYDGTVCQNINSFYKPAAPELILTGMYKINGDNILSFGINTGYSSQKLSVSPSFLIGGAMRFYTSEKKDSHFILEGNYWFGSSVTHRPCLDSYERQYFCGNLSAWSDFQYDRHPESYNIKLWYEKLF